MSRLMEIYHRSPPRVRSIAATARGFVLRGWRYGKETEGLVEEALEREYWDPDRWNEWTDQRLAYMLHRAATRVPYYRDQWAERRRKGDRSSWEVLSNWPVLEKETVRGQAESFIADDRRRRSLFHDHTSGTTGKSLSVWLSRRNVRYWYALHEARARRWHGISRRDNWAILGGQLVVSISQKRPPFWVWNAALKQLYMSSYHLAPDLVGLYIEALKKYKIKYLLGYPSAIYELALEVRRAAVSKPSLDVIITNAEPVFSYQRAAIKDAFGCPLRETYGLAEIVTAASECQCEMLHMWPEAGYVEFLKGSERVNEGETGDFVCTGLINDDMPLIRYRNGDQGALAPRRSVACQCRRTLPILSSLEGRSDDVIYTREGRRVGRLDPVFKTGLGIVEAQIVQETLTRISVRIVPEHEFSSRERERLISRIRKRVGDIQVDVELYEKIPRDANGKFRAVVCNLTAEEKVSVNSGRT